MSRFRPKQRVYILHGKHAGRGGTIVQVHKGQATVYVEAVRSPLLAMFFGGPNESISVPLKDLIPLRRGR